MDNANNLDFLGIDFELQAEFDEIKVTVMSEMVENKSQVLSYVKVVGKIQNYITEKTH